MSEGDILVISMFILLIFLIIFVIAFMVPIIEFVGIEGYNFGTFIISSLKGTV